MITTKIEYSNQDFYFNNKKIGFFVNYNIFITFRDSDKHFMRKYNGFGVSIEVLDRLERLGIKYIIFRVKGGLDYMFKIEQYKQSNLVHNFKGNDLQKFVDINECMS